MTFTDSIRTCFFKYATFTGRATRSEFWWFALFYYGFFYALFALLAAVQTILGPWYPREVMGFVGTAALIAVYGGALVPYLALSVRRLHDADHKGWWLFICLIPLIGWIILLVFYLQRSDEGSNRFDVADPT